MQAFASLQWHAQHAREKKAMLVSVLQHLRQRSLAATFAGMQEQCNQKRQLHIVDSLLQLPLSIDHHLVTQLTRISCMQAFASLQRHAQRRREKKATLASVLQRLRQSSLAAAFAGMRKQCSQKRQLRFMATKAIAYWKGSLIVATFFTWTDRTREKRQLKTKVMSHSS